jgi:hypothetical protein
MSGKSPAYRHHRKKFKETRARKRPRVFSFQIFFNLIFHSSFLNRAAAARHGATSFRTLHRAPQRAAARTSL